MTGTILGLLGFPKSVIGKAANWVPVSFLLGLTASPTLPPTASPLSIAGNEFRDVACVGLALEFIVPR